MSSAQPLKNQRHERFAQLIAKGKPASTAYIEAGYSPAGAEPNGSKLIRNNKVAARIEHLKQTAAEKSLISAEWVLERLQAEALGLGPDTTSSARTKATELLGKYLSMFTERIEHTGGVAITFIDDDDLDNET
jgi:phage terminase small subunit